MQIYAGLCRAVVKVWLKRVNETLNRKESGSGTINLQSQPEQTGF
jgi:hypothetical protein